MDQKEKVLHLIEHGLVEIIDGDLMLSSEAMALITNTSPGEWDELAQSTGCDVARIPDAFARKARRGAKEVQALLGSDNLLEVLYAKAVNA